MSHCGNNDRKGNLDKLFKVFISKLNKGAYINILEILLKIWFSIVGYQNFIMNDKVIRI